MRIAVDLKIIRVKTLLIGCLSKFNRPKSERKTASFNRSRVCLMKDMTDDSKARKDIPLRPPLAAQDPQIEPAAEIEKENEPARYPLPRDHRTLLQRSLDARRRPGRQTPEERTGFILPVSIEDAQERLISLLAEIELVRSELDTKTVDFFPDDQSYRSWRKKAGFSIGHMKANRVLLRGWIDQKTREVAEPEQANFTPPLSPEEGKIELASVSAEITLLGIEINGKSKDAFVNDRQRKAWRSAMNLRLGLLKARRTFLDGWLAAGRSKGSTAKAALALLQRHESAAQGPEDPEIPNIHLPSSIDEGEEWFARTTAERFAVQSQLSELSIESLGHEEYRTRRADLVRKMTALESKQILLKAWLKQEHKKRSEEVSVRRTEILKNFDPNDPVSLILHGQILFRKILKAHQILLSEEDAVIMDHLTAYLRKNGCIV
jgi:hypothetical protein